MLENALIIAQKEIKDALRDPSSLFAAILYALMGPIMLAIILNLSMGTASEKIDKHINLIGADPQSIISQHLQDDGFIFDQDAKIKLILDDQLTANLNGGKQAKVTIEADFSDINETARLLENSLRKLHDIFIEKRLKLVNLDLDYVNPIKIERKNTQPSSFLQTQMVSIFILIFLMPIGFTAMSLTIDMTAGERERLSLEPLLAQPITSLSIMVGKWMVAILLTLVGCLLSISLSILILKFLPASEIVENINLTAYSGLKIFFLLIPLCMMMTAIQLAFALYAKSYKEGITYLGILALPPIIMPFLSNSILEQWAYLPIFHEIGLIKSTLISTPQSTGLQFTGILLTVVVAAICIYYAQRKLKQESILA